MLNKLLNVISEMRKAEEEHIIQILQKKDTFENKLSLEKQKLPYVINLLDEVRPNENAHSRILIRLLQFSENGKYPLLESFLNYLGEPFTGLIFENPVFTTERDRIDARIRDSNRTKSIILENKVHFAVEQEKQIERYVDNEIKSGFNEENIYVLHLSRDGGTASEFSLSSIKRSSLKTRYRDINYRDDILGWLEKIDLNILANNSLNKPLLRSAIVQYINHIEGLFLIRKGEEIMKNEMIEIIKKEFNLFAEKSLSAQLDKVSAYKDYINDLQAYISQIEKEIAFSALQTFGNELCVKTFDNISIERLQPIKKFGVIGSGIIFKPYGWKDKYSIRLEFEGDLCSLFFGIFNSKGDSQEQLSNALHNVFEQKDLAGPPEIWPYWEWVSKESNYEYLVKEIESGALSRTIEIMVNKTIANTLNISDLRS